MENFINNAFTEKINALKNKHAVVKILDINTRILGGKINSGSIHKELIKLHIAHVHERNKGKEIITQAHKKKSSYRARMSAYKSLIKKKSKEKIGFYNLSKKKRKAYVASGIGNIKAALLIFFTTCITVFILLFLFLLVFYSTVIDTYKIAVAFGLLVFISNFTSKTYLYTYEK